jgi:hypothetical protein
MVPELKKNARVAERKETFLKNYLIDLQKFLEIFFPILKFSQVKEKNVFNMAAYFFSWGPKTKKL